MDSNSPKDQKRIVRVELACVACRARHMKCDAAQPTCRRCAKDGKECVYLKSRRGGLDKAALARRRLALQQQAEREQQTETSISHTSSGRSSTSDDNNELSALSIDYSALTRAPTSTSNELTFAINSDRLLDLYYEYFHNGHPLVLPQQYLNQRLLRDDHALDALVAVMQYVGSIYAPWTLSDPFREKAEHALFSHGIQNSAFYVQALTIFAIAQHHCAQKIQASKILDTAINVAFTIGLNNRDFATKNGEGNRVIEESFRRTYYMLYLTDQHFAIVSNTATFALRDISMQVELPCEDYEYASGQIPSQPATWEEYEVRDLSDVEVVYSSFTYLLDVIKTVAYIQRRFVEEGGAMTEELVSEADAKLAIWMSLLPSTKREPLRLDGSLDELLFFAHLILSISTIHLHRPLSSISFSREEMQTSSFLCSIPPVKPPWRPSSRPGHTAKTLKALEMQTKLLALPGTFTSHCLFSTCIFAIITATQVAACTVLLDDRPLAIARDRIRLSIGVLNTVGEYWPLARLMAKEVRVVARSAFASTRISQTPVMQLEPTAIHVSADDTFWSPNALPHIDIYSGLELPNIPMDWDMEFGSLNPAWGV